MNLSPLQIGIAGSALIFAGGIFWYCISRPGLARRTGRIVLAVIALLLAVWLLIPGPVPMERIVGRIVGVAPAVMACAIPLTGYVIILWVSGLNVAHWLNCRLHFRPLEGRTPVEWSSAAPSTAVRRNPKLKPGV